MDTATVVHPDDRQRIAWIGGSVHEVVFDGVATGGRLTAFWSSMRAGAASPVHVHDEDDETIFVLEWSGVFWAGERQGQHVLGPPLAPGDVMPAFDRA